MIGSLLKLERILPPAQTPHMTTSHPTTPAILVFSGMGSAMREYNPASTITAKFDTREESTDITNQSEQYIRAQKTDQGTH